eukprot:CAMPEP_0176302676 /NCGR_PEP_ID=MMETSP0121_2-20121125/61509_1 /TAXON_ID=160619 /ORGANISM="Kryptoperidinium foliaceum, Strain CCMP 1326" /LENGTH=62 /DNA_ID=CAMNT_0017644201 /DNA_START=259 /DNA_END=444 /DNA_ORIENTATION=+
MSTAPRTQKMANMMTPSACNCCAFRCPCASTGWYFSCCLHHASTEETALAEATTCGFSRATF